MATQVYEETTVVLMDGTEVKMRPLKISSLRKFMKAFDGIAAVMEDSDKSMDILMECSSIAMEQYAPEYADLAVLEENVDLPTVYKIIEAASGIKFGDEGNETATGIRGLS